MKAIKRTSFDIAKEYLDHAPATADPTDGKIIAVKICSHVLDACIWLAFDDDFKPDNDEPLAVFYAHEITFLKSKTREELREIHKWKLTFGPGSLVRQ